MIDDGINVGGFVFTRCTDSAEPGKIIIVIVDDETAFMRYYPEAEIHTASGKQIHGGHRYQQ